VFRPAHAAHVDAVEQQRPLFRTDASPAVTGETPTMRQKALRAALQGAEDSMRTGLEVTIDTITNQ